MKRYGRAEGTKKRCKRKTSHRELSSINYFLPLSITFYQVLQSTSVNPVNLCISTYFSCLLFLNFHSASKRILFLPISSVFPFSCFPFDCPASHRHSRATQTQGKHRRRPAFNILTVRIKRICLPHGSDARMVWLVGSAHGKHHPRRPHLLIGPLPLRRKCKSSRLAPESGVMTAKQA